MADDNKLYLPYVLDGILAKLSALFFQKMILFDSQILEAKHLRHYDYECEGLASLINFCERRINKHQVFAVQMIKNYGLEYQDDGQYNHEDELKVVTPKTSYKNIEGMTTPRTKFFTGANTTFQQSDNSFVFSPNVKKNAKMTSRTQYLGGSIIEENQKQQILRKLLNRVKQVNTEAYQQSLHPAKSSYFNLTLGKQSHHTFDNNCHCSCHNQSCQKDSKLNKRKRILQKFETIERKIYQEPSFCMTVRSNRMPDSRVKGHHLSNTAYSVYEPFMYDERPRQIIYVTSSRVKNQPTYELLNNGLSSSKSVTHISYAKQVYV